MFVKPLNMFQFYLRNMKHYVITDMGESYCRDVTDGVPQGSVLGSSLFLVAINNVRVNVPTEMVLYVGTPHKKFTPMVTRNSNYMQLVYEVKYNVAVVKLANSK